MRAKQGARGVLGATINQNKDREMSEIIDGIEDRIQQDAQRQADADAEQFRSDLLELISRHGIDDFMRTIAGPAVSAYTARRKNQLAERRRAAVIDRLLGGSD